MTKGPLAGVRVLDLSRVLAGPWCTQLLGDLGANVIKIEMPGSGDDTRGWGPPYVDERAGVSAYFAATNRNKISLTADLASVEGRTRVKALLASADVLVENFKVGGLAPYGLSYEQLAPQHPRLVYCSITGFGQTGPHAARPGYDFMIQAMAGLMSLTGEAEGPALKTGVAVADLMTGMYAATAILAALRHRDQTGLGQHIDLALFDTQVAWLANQAANYLVGGRVPTRLGNAHPNIVPYQTFSTLDGDLALAAGNDGQFRRLCEVLDVPALARDPRFLTNDARVRNRDELVPALARVFAQAPRAHWLARLQAASVPAAPVNALDEVFDDPQIEARGLRVDLEREGARVPMVGCPIKLSRTPATYRFAPPSVGEHDALAARGWDIFADC